MLLNIFDVDHGACALIATSNGRRVMIDCGHNALTRWYPGSQLARAGVSWLDCLYITNFDEDHVSGFGNLMAQVNVDVLIKNGTVGPSELARMKSQHGMGPGISLVHRAMKETFTGGAPMEASFDNFGDTTFTVYRNPYNPAYGFSDPNNLSLAIFVQCGPHKILFPGDLEKPGWKGLLQNSGFVRELQGVSLFVASHHGRDSGYCPEVMSLCPNIDAVIISDTGKVYQTQETTERYRQHASGFVYNHQHRRVLTTRRDGSMQFQLNQTGSGVVSLNLAA